jgi:replication-associated recombination protein RarA
LVIYSACLPGAALLVGGGAEITYVRRRMARTCSAEIGTPR